MFGIFRRDDHTPGEQSPPPAAPGTLAFARQIGADSGSGQVPVHKAFTDPDVGGRVDDLGRHELVKVGQLDAVRTPESWYADRPLYGGVRTAGAVREYIEEPGNTGGHVVLTGRVPYVITDPITVREEAPAEPSHRVAPPAVPDVCRRVAAL